ncbi:MAG: UPF0175 family protein [Chitinophagales bacterium]
MNLLISETTLKKADISANELLIEIATYLYDKERLSFGQAKTLCGLNYLAFQKELGKRDIYVKYEVEDLENDLKNLASFRAKKNI